MLSGFFLVQILPFQTSIRCTDWSALKSILVQSEDVAAGPKFLLKGSDANAHGMTLMDMAILMYILEKGYCLLWTT